MSGKLMRVMGVTVTGLVAIVVMSSLISTLDTESWSPVVKIFVTVGIPVILAVGMVLMILKEYQGSRQDSGVETVNPFVSLVGWLRKEKRGSPNEGTVPRIFNDNDMYVDEEESAPRGEKNRRFTNPVSALVDRIRAK